MEEVNAIRTVNENDDQVSEKDVEDDDDFVWEQGETTYLNAAISGDYEKTSGRDWNGEVSLSVNNNEANSAAAVGGGNGTVKRKPSQRRATAQDKEYAELIHKAHLLCLLARGRVVDAACDDALLQASLLSLIPPSLGISADVPAVPTTKALGGFVSWFMRSFRVAAAGEGPSSSSQAPSQEDFTIRLRHCIEKQAGSAEELAALAVALLRSLGFMTRYVTILDVVSLKPDAESLEASGSSGSSLYEQSALFSSQNDMETTRVASLAQILAHSVPQTVNGSKRNFAPSSDRGSPSTSGACPQDLKPSPRGRGKKWFSVDGDRGLSLTGSPSLRESNSKPSRGRGKAKAGGRGQLKTESVSGVYERPPEPEVELAGKKRSGDEEFERQLAMAIAATAAEAEAKNFTKPETSEGNASATPPPHASDAKRPLKRIKGLGSSSGNASGRQKLGLASKQEVIGSNGAVWSRKSGPVMHWAEVYCCEEGGPRRWVHVDAAKGIVDGADKIEGAAAACRLPLRYVLAFAGSGAKDVTRRYVTLWSTVDRHRVDQDWWDNTLNPLKQLEAAATAGPAQTVTSLPSTSSQAETATKGTNGWTSKPDIHHGDRSALEDMEMETKTFTEPLPTNQQAYRSHHLYVLEKWLTKYQTLYPKGPVLGYCAGHPVYPRACVQVLHTPDSWLREGFKVKPGESPAKLVKASRFVVKKTDSPEIELDGEEEKKEEKTTTLYGKWQTHPWQPPRAVDGKVPRNERGQVDVWSEKCIPPGTVHLRYPGLVPVAQKLGIDFAPAMVGFEVRRGRTFPVYDGIVVCEEFKDVIMDAHTVHEEARFSELWKKREENAAKRWRSLLQSMATRQRLQATYEAPTAVATKPKHRQTLASSKALPVAEPLKSATDGAFPIDSQSDLAKMKGAQKQGQGLQPQHVHQFPAETQSYDEDTGIRTKVCACGFTYFVEEM
ncbi:unnamed protein product [Calypogeia fissa]